MKIKKSNGTSLIPIATFFAGALMMVLGSIVFPPAPKVNNVQSAKANAQNVAAQERQDARVNPVSPETQFSLNGKSVTMYRQTSFFTPFKDANEKLITRDYEAPSPSLADIEYMRKNGMCPKQPSPELCHVEQRENDLTVAWMYPMHPAMGFSTLEASLIVVPNIRNEYYILKREIPALPQILKEARRGYAGLSCELSGGAGCDAAGKTYQSTLDAALAKPSAEMKAFFNQLKADAQDIRIEY
jgi:hypothetical protein